jgi:hypothetical protein
VALLWAVWAEEALFLGSEVDLPVVSEADSEDEVHSVHPVALEVTDTWVLVPVAHLAETLVTTCMPITMVPREGLVVLLPSLLAYVPSQPSPTSRFSSET